MAEVEAYLLVYDPALLPRFRRGLEGLVARRAVEPARRATAEG